MMEQVLIVAMDIVDNYQTKKKQNILNLLFSL